MDGVRWAMDSCRSVPNISVSISVSTRACHYHDRAKAGFDSPTESELFMANFAMLLITGQRIISTRDSKCPYKFWEAVVEIWR